VEVAVIAELMSLMRHPMNKLGPPLGVTPENEEGGAHALLGECVQDARRRVWIWTVVERESNYFAIALDSAQRRSEDGAVTVEGTVYGSAEDGDSQCCKRDHSCVFLPSTAV
jgi:hypothetical protein